MKIEHIAMYVNDLERAKEFFVKYLDGRANDGYHNRARDFCSSFISFDDGARLEIMTKPGLANQDKPLNRTGFVHVAFSVGSKERVDELTARLKADGFEVVSGPRTTGDGYYESCVVGIEENQIEIAGEYPAKALELLEKALDQMTFFVGIPIDRPRSITVLSWRNGIRGILRLNVLTNSLRSICFVPKDIAAFPVRLLE